MNGRTVGILVVGIALRLAAIASSGPFLSDDLWRHLWDGRVGAAGESPYAHAPADPATTRLRDAEVWPRLNHPEYRTIYGPTAQAFVTAAAAGGATTSRSYRAAALVVEIPALLLAARTLSPSTLALWTLHPLVVWEGYAEGHADLLMGALVLAALAARGTSPGAAGFLFAAGGLVKYWPLAFLGIVAPRGARGRFFAGALTAVALLFLPYFSSGEVVFESVRAYQRHWDFNASLHAILGVDAWTADKAVARAAVAAVAVLAGYAVRSAALGAGLLFLAAPTVYPWYLVGVLPFLAMPDEGERIPEARWAIVAWTFTVLAAHAVHLRPAGSEWEPPPVAWAVEYLPVFALLAWAGWAAARRVLRCASLRTSGEASSCAPA